MLIPSATDSRLEAVVSESNRALFEALEALHTDLSLQLQQARVAAAGLIADSRMRERVSPVTDRQRRTRIIEHSTTASVLREVVQELEELLGDDEARRRLDEQLEPRGLSTPRVGDDVEGPEPF